MTPAHPEKYSAAEWDHLRERFSNSALKETEIAVLGQNASISWPFKGSDETPSKYIEYDYEELQSVPGLIGKKRRIRTLMDILRETLAFDDPFEDMLDMVELDHLKDSTFDHILVQFNIAADYPAAFARFSPETKQMLASEGLVALIDAIHFGQTLEQNAPVGGDLKNFINGLAHKDEAGIAKQLPYRRGERGLYLAEAIGLIAGDLDSNAQLVLLHQSGVALTQEETAQRERADVDRAAADLNAALAEVDARCKWFAKEAAALHTMLSEGGEAERYFIPINDPHRERIAAALIRAHFGIGVGGEKRGLFGKLSGIFGR